MSKHIVKIEDLQIEKVIETRLCSHVGINCKAKKLIVVTDLINNRAYYKVTCADIEEVRNDIKEAIDVYNNIDETRI